MRTSDMYGSRTKDLNQLRIDIETVLGMQFEAHWSDMRGGDYFLWRSEDSPGRERLSIIRNHHSDLGDYYPATQTEEPEFAEYQLLFRLEGTFRGDQLKSKLINVAGLDFLRRIVW